jgi:hypothetical protein
MIHPVKADVALSFTGYGGPHWCDNINGANSPGMIALSAFLLPRQLWCHGSKNGSIWLRMVTPGLYVVGHGVYRQVFLEMLDYYLDRPTHTSNPSSYRASNCDALDRLKTILCHSR